MNSGNGASNDSNHKSRRSHILLLTVADLFSFRLDPHGAGSHPRKYTLTPVPGQCAGMIASSPCSYSRQSKRLHVIVCNVGSLIRMCIAHLQDTVQHKYEDKYILVESTINTAIASFVNLLGSSLFVRCRPYVLPVVSSLFFLCSSFLGEGEGCFCKCKRQFFACTIVAACLCALSCAASRIAALFGRLLTADCWRSGWFNLCGCIWGRRRRKGRGG